MKILYSSLNCPHCGAKNFNLIEKDIFLCEYCNQKFNCDLDSIDLTNENKLLIEELKEEYYNKILTLEKEKSKNKSMLVYYSKLANDRKLSTLFLVLIFISIMFILSYPFTVLGLICLPIFTVLYVIFLKKNKKRYDKYYPLASTYAYNIVLIEEEIAIYTKLISKLTK